MYFNLELSRSDAMIKVTLCVILARSLAVD